MRAVGRMWMRRESQPDPLYKPQKIEMADAKLNRQYTMGMTPGPSAQDERRFAARVLADVIGDSDGSRFYWALVDNAIAEDADFGFYPHDGCGSFYIALVTEPERSEKALDIALKELERVKKDLDGWMKWSARKTRSPAGWCSRVNRPWAGCAASAGSGCTTGNIVRWKKTWPR